jgi:hypothetical protein
MRQLIAVLALSSIVFLASQTKGQDKDTSDQGWPSLGNAEKSIHEEWPRFIIEQHKLELAQNVSNPLAVTRCRPSPEGCIPWVRLDDFFSELKGERKESFLREVEAHSRTLRPGVMMHHYPHALFERHYRGTGTYVFYLPQQNVFYLWGDCAMDHGDEVAGPYAGDPRLLFKKLAEDPDSVAQLGELIVPFQSQGQGVDSTNEAWPTVPGSGIDVSKLDGAQNVSNPLSLDRCRTPFEKCVIDKRDFSSERRNRLGLERWILRPDVIAHYYPGLVPQYVFYLPKQNIFYVAGFSPSATNYLALGPYAGDPRLVLKKLERPGPK